jgi:hypothetical protein
MDDDDDETDTPNPLGDLEEFEGPRNVLNELYGIAVAANDMAAAKTLYDTNFPTAPALTAMQYKYLLKSAVPPTPPPNRPISPEVSGPISPGRRIVYAQTNSVVDLDIRKRIKGRRRADYPG